MGAELFNLQGLFGDCSQGPVGQIIPPAPVADVPDKISTTINVFAERSLTVTPTKMGTVVSSGSALIHSNPAANVFADP